jgi:hypothetical protein
MITRDVFLFLLNNFWFDLLQWGITDRFTGEGVWIWIVKVEVLDLELLRDAPLASIFNKMLLFQVLQTQLRIFLGY